MPKMKFENIFKYKFQALVVAFELLFWTCAFLFLLVNGYFQKSETTNHLLFVNPNFTWLFILVFIFVLIVVKIKKNREKILQKIPDALKTYFFKIGNEKSWFIYYFLIRNLLVFLIIALMQPIYGKKATNVKSAASEVVFIVDISASMNTRDMSPSTTRMEAAKRAMNQIVNISSAARYGIIAFAGNAFPHLPLTADKGSVKLFIEQLNTDLISVQGTDIGYALNLASNFFSKDKLRKIAILITDGEDHEGGVKEALNLLKENQIELHILGLGTVQGGVVPKDVNNPEKGSLKDFEGNPVISSLSLDLIDNLTKQSGGFSEVSSDGFPNVSNLLTLINNSSATKKVDLELEIEQNWFREALMIAILNLLVLFTWQITQYRSADVKKG